MRNAFLMSQDWGGFSHHFTFYKVLGASYKNNFKTPASTELCKLTAHYHITALRMEQAVITSEPVKPGRQTGKTYFLK